VVRLTGDQRDSPRINRSERKRSSPRRLRSVP
jgi:hypothetical protein